MKQQDRYRRMIHTLLEEMPQYQYVCLNYEEQPVPEEIRDHSVMISGDSDQVIQELVS